MTGQMILNKALILNIKLTVMKTKKNLLFISITAMLFAGCEEKIVDRYMVNVPVYMDRHEFKNAVKVTGSENIVEPGKIYFKDNLIFINEALKGIHVIDNSDPAAPVFVSFIGIPGNVDMAIKDNILFADSYIDLVALDISDIYNISEVGRVDSIFPYSLPLLKNSQLPMGEVDLSKGIVVGWEVKEVEEVQTQQTWIPFLWREDVLYDNTSVSSKVSTYSGESSSMSVGIGGSMARFTICDNFLYTVDQYNLKVFDIDELSNPLLVSDQSIGWDIETVFQYQKKLFFGTTTGMLIYDISNPASPNYVSTYSHIRSCDPVVVEGDYAYVTLRAGNLCGEATSQLDVINVSNIEKPKWEQSYPMQEPYGLGVDNKTLFVCDGGAGLKVYNADDPKNLVKIGWFSDINAFDVIPYNGILMMIGTGGLYQYDYTGPENMSLLSHIPIQSREK
jgi:hypothetical protein